MAKKSQSLLEILDFGNEAGDDVEPEDLAPYFYEQTEFSKFLSKEDRISISTGKRALENLPSFVGWNTKYANSSRTTS
jgi:hypothetical protein